MQVKMEVNDVTITLGNKGVVLKISDNGGKHVGDLRIGKAPHGRTSTPRVRTICIAVKRAAPVSSATIGGADGTSWHRAIALDTSQV